MKKNLSVLMMVLLSALLIISCNNSSKKVYTVTFDPNGGSKVDSVEVKEGEKVTKPTDPTKDKYKFDKWTTDEAGTEEYDFESGVTGNITLYAQWGDYYKVGDKGPAGGIIFYVNPDYEEGSSDSAKNWKYLEAAPASWSTEFAWGPNGSEYNTEEGVGKGKSNTEKLMSMVSETVNFPAAKACDDYDCTNSETGVVYDDWFLPSYGELDKLYAIRDKLDSVSVSYDDYWSSYGYGGSNDLAKVRYFKTSTWSGNQRTTSTSHVWPVRSFAL